MRRVPFALVLLVACRAPDRARGPEPGAPAGAPRGSYPESIPASAVSFDLVFVPAGRATTPDGRPVEVKAFWIGRNEVTWDEYLLFQTAPPGTNDGFARPSPPYEPPDHGMGMGRRPATSLRRHAAEMYCAWLSKKTGRNYRLPTEEEWELAARAGDAKDAPEPLGEFAWIAENCEGKSQPVGGKRPNALGIHDALGNSWEYCAGPFSTADPAPVLRGGSWGDPAAEVGYRARVRLPDEWSERDPQRPRSRWWLTDGSAAGFRVARDAD